MRGLIDSGGSYAGQVYNGSGDIAVVIAVPSKQLPAFTKEIGNRLASVHYLHTELLPAGKTKAPLKSLRLAWVRVQREIKAFSPQVKRIAVLGGTDTLRVLVPKFPGTIDDSHGTLLTIDDWIVVPIQPAAWSHLKPVQDKDIARLLRLEKPSEPLPYVNGIPAWLRDQVNIPASVVLDVESDGLEKGPDVSTHSLTGITIQWSDVDRAIITGDDMPLAIYLLTKAMPQIENLIAHNYQYDGSFMGSEFRALAHGKIRDTLLRARSRGEHNAGLKHLGNFYTRSPGCYSYCKPGEFSFDDPSYMTQDTDVTWRLWKLWRNENTQSVKLYERCASMMTEQTINGSAIDTVALETIAEKGAKLAEELEAALTEKYGCDPGSAELIVKLEELGYKFSERTRTGEVSLTAKILEDHGLTDIVEWRKAQKLDSAFVQKIKSLLRADGTLPHSQKLCEADTGRTSMSEYNWQQAGRKGPVRELMVSRFDDGMIASFDLSQNELRAACYYAEDEVFAAALMSSDAHRDNAAMAFNVATESVTAEQRDDAKIVVFRSIFGGMPQNEGQERVADSLKQRFPKLTRYLDNAKRQAERTGQAVSAWGKVRKLDEVLDYRGRWAVGRAGVNSPIQGIASDFALWLTVRLWELMRDNGLKSLVLMGIHDSVILDVYPGEYDTIVQLTRVAFAQLGVILRKQFKVASILCLAAEMQCGVNWADTKKGDKVLFSTNEGLDFDNFN